MKTKMKMKMKKKTKKRKRRKKKIHHLYKAKHVSDERICMSKL